MTNNFARNIIVNLASLPDFLRLPILRKRMVEFFDLPQDEQRETIANALEAGSSIPFPNFAKLFRTWLEILASLPEEQRYAMFSLYVQEVARGPSRLIGFNLDGILGVFLLLDCSQQETISETMRTVIDRLNDEDRRRIMLVMPDSAKERLGL